MSQYCGECRCMVPEPHEHPVGPAADASEDALDAYLRQNEILKSKLKQTQEHLEKAEREMLRAKLEVTERLERLRAVVRLVKEPLMDGGDALMARLSALQKGDL